MSLRKLVPIATFTMLAGAPGLLSAQVWEVDNQLLRYWGTQSEIYYGYAVAVGDFDGDGDDDLVAGAPHWDSATAENLGLWEIFLSGPGRTLTSQLATHWVTEDNFWAGFALAAGDFDGDGRDEIAIARPGQDIDEWIDAGAVGIHEYESEWVLGTSLSQLGTQGAAEHHDQFGYRLVVGNFDGDAYEDLAVGVPLEDTSGGLDVGAVQVFYGGSYGLSQNESTVLLSPSGAAGDQFGLALAAGDFDGDGYDDLAIGVPFRNVAAHSDAGGVEIFFGSPGGVSQIGPQILAEADFGGTALASDYFGYSLAAGNFDETAADCDPPANPCRDDLAIGMPGQTVNYPAAGRVIVGYGGATGIQTVGWTLVQSATVGASTQAGDWFGSDLAAGHLDHAAGSDQYEDLAVATIFENAPGAADSGFVHLVFGSGSGINAGQPAQGFGQKPGFAIAPAAEGDRWGEALAIGDLDGDGWGDLVVGVPYKDPNGVVDAGAVQVLYGALFADGFESGGWTGW